VARLFLGMGRAVFEVGHPHRRVGGPAADLQNETAQRDKTILNLLFRLSEWRARDQDSSPTGITEAALLRMRYRRFLAGNG
jgi:hypothetical protein